MSVIEFTDRGIYCPAGDFYIDPWRSVDRAVITHAHSDHARSGHRAYLSTPITAAVMRHRLGAITADTVEYGEPRTIGRASVSLHPAGHVPGSAQIRIEVNGEVAVISGDYKRENDCLSTPFEPLQCHSFVSECTFGLPAFRWPDPTETFAEIALWQAQNASDGKLTILTAYGLGKAQRLIHGLAPLCGPIYTHSAVENTNAILRHCGVSVPPTIPLTPRSKAEDLKKGIIIMPPAAADSVTTRKWGPCEVGFASGWMRLRGIRRRRGVDRGFVMSDHADWSALNDTIATTRAQNIYVTHGYTDSFAKWLNDTGHNASIVPTEFGGDEDTG